MFMILSFYLFFVFFCQLVTLYLSFSPCFRHVAKIAAKIAKKNVRSPPQVNTSGGPSGVPGQHAEKLLTLQSFRKNHIFKFCKLFLARLQQGAQEFPFYFRRLPVGRVRNMDIRVVNGKRKTVNGIGKPFCAFCVIPPTFAANRRNPAKSRPEN